MILIDHLDIPVLPIDAQMDDMNQDEDMLDPRPGT
jgi:hypothetical protein